MKKIYLIAIAIILGNSTFAQEEKAPDTTRMTVGNTEIIFVGHDNDDEDIIIVDGDTISEHNHHKHHKRKSEAHWAGVDFGFRMLMNNNFENKFEEPYWNNDPAKSLTWNLNLLEHKFNIAKPWFGVTTGLGFSFTSLAIKDNYVLVNSPDTLVGYVDTVYSYSKNKLKAAYLTVPLLLEFNTSANSNRSFYLAAGVVGGVRIGSRVKRKGEFDGKEFREVDKAKYGLEPFTLDGLVRMGYSDWGVFASYSLLPLFDTNKTAEVYPLTFGLSFNF